MNKSDKLLLNTIFPTLKSSAPKEPTESEALATSLREKNARLKALRLAKNT